MKIRPSKKFFAQTRSTIPFAYRARYDQLSDKDKLAVARIWIKRARQFLTWMVENERHPLLPQIRQAGIDISTVEMCSLISKRSGKRNG